MKNDTTILNKLNTYHTSDYYGFHMPGHKRNTNLFGDSLPYGIDITEIEGFDDLHHCEGILLDSQKLASKVFHAEETFYLINGSTVGNMAAIMSVTNRGDKILVARNNHKSVYNSVFLQDLKPIYIYPQFDEKNSINGEISNEDVCKLLIEEKDIKAIVVVSPTYDGVISDIKAIGDTAHRYGIPLIVDEAHGAHLGMHKYFSKNSNELGADIVIHSVHKTLPSLTQTGLLHVNGSLVDRDKLKRYLKILQSSSPSYVLLSSIDRCVHLLKAQGDVLFTEYVTMLRELREKLRELKNLELVEKDQYDNSKILISVRSTNITSRELYTELLDQYHLQMEMCGADYVIGMTSVGDTKEGLLRLQHALFEIDHRLIKNVITGKRETIRKEAMWSELPRLKQGDDSDVRSEWFYYLYPPGIPFVVPGEVITEDIELRMENYRENGFTIQKG